MMSEPVKIYRSTFLFLMFAVLASGFILIDIMKIREAESFEAWLTTENIVFAVFTLLFVIPSMTWSIYLAFTKQTYLSLYPDAIEISVCAFPFRRLKISMADLVDVKTNWGSGSGSDRSDIIFFVRKSAFDVLSRAKMWRKKDQKNCALYWVFTNAEKTPAEVVQIIHLQLQPTRWV